MVSSSDHMCRPSTDMPLVGKYVGNRPIRLKKAENSIHSVEIGHNKAKQLAKNRGDKRQKPY